MYMDNCLVILLGYKSLSGKDTFYNAIQDLGFIRCAFADKLKDTVKDLYNLADDQVFGDLKDVPDLRYQNLIDSGTRLQALPYLTPRRILQVFGQQQRQLNPHIWPSYVFNTVIPKQWQQGHNKFVITDFRFKNEHQVAKEWAKLNKVNLVTIKIDRPIEAKSGAFDISEIELDDFKDWTYVINNSKDLFTYKAECRKLAAQVVSHSL
jgi:hypothetical protein